MKPIGVATGGEVEVSYLSVNYLFIYLLVRWLNTFTWVELLLRLLRKISRSLHGKFCFLKFQLLFYR